jgi:signal transduction histidine kinase
MRLGTRITLLTLSTFVITIGIGIVSIHLATFLAGRDRVISGHPFLLARVETIFRECEDSGDFSGFAARLPPTVDAAVLDADRVVLASSFPSLPKGAALKGVDLFARLPKAGFSLVSPMQEKRGERLIVIHLRDARSLLPSPSLVILPLLFILILLSLVSVLLTRGMLSSTYRSLAALRSASSRIAAGDLESRVEARGTDEVGGLARDFDRMRTALREDYDRRARFLMGVSHDLKTPLTSIRGYIEAMQDGLADDPEVRVEYLKVLDAKSRMLEDRLVELLDFGRMETGEWRLKLEQIPLHEFLQSLCREFEIDARMNGRQFASHLDIPPECAAAADLVLFARVLENLVGNAIRYTRQDDRIDFTASGGGTSRQVVIEVRDSGPGIDSNELALVFEPFFRGTRTRSEPGFGLGLSIVKSIVEAHGWSITVASRPEGGTAFRLVLPVDGGARATG